jgi:hypothetical protein
MMASDAMTSLITAFLPAHRSGHRNSLVTSPGVANAPVLLPEHRCALKPDLFSDYVRHGRSLVTVVFIQGKRLVAPDVGPYLSKG